MTFRSIDDIAELRRPHEVASFLPGLSAFEQRDWVRELQSRVEHAGTDAPVVCLLDRGVQAGHPLLEDSLAADDLHSVEPSWRKDVAIHAHGTEMAGLALYGDLQKPQSALSTASVWSIGSNQQSCSLTLGTTIPMYRAVTARAIDQPEISALNRAGCSCWPSLHLPLRQTQGIVSKTVRSRSPGVQPHGQPRSMP